MQKKRILAALLSAAMVITSAAVPVLADELDEPAPQNDAIELAEEPETDPWADMFTEGDGSPEKPYKIGDKDTFLAFANKVNEQKYIYQTGDTSYIENAYTYGKFFELTADITIDKQMNLPQ